ncbi:hypothetical protein D3C71_1546140 [compost metagenome]
MRAGFQQSPAAAVAFNLGAAVLVVEYQAVEKGIKVDPAGRFGAAVHAAGVSHAFAHQVFHFIQVAPELVPFDPLIHHFDPQLHASDRCLQVVGNGCQQLHAFLEVGSNARLQGVESHGSVAHLAWAAFIQLYAGLVRVEVVHCPGQTG